MAKNTAKNTYDKNREAVMDILENMAIERTKIDDDKSSLKPTLEKSPTNENYLVDKPWIRFSRN